MQARREVHSADHGSPGSGQGLAAQSFAWHLYFFGLTIKSVPVFRSSEKTDFLLVISSLVSIPLSPLALASFATRVENLGGKEDIPEGSEMRVF